MSEFSDVSFDSGLHKHKYGNSNVQYSSDGRVLSREDFEQQRRTFQRRDDHGSSPRTHYQAKRLQDSRMPPRPARPRGYYNTGFDHPAGSGSDYRDDRPRNTHRFRTFSDLDRNPHHPRGSHRYRDDERLRTTPTWREKDNYSGAYRRQAAPRQQRRSRLSAREEQDSETMKTYGKVFTGVGLLILVGGLLNILFGCKHHYYSAFWGGFMVLEYGIILIIHRGEYYKHMKTMTNIIIGVLTVLAVFVALALLLDKLDDDLSLLLFDNNPTATYEQLYSNVEWTVQLSGVTTSAHVWVSFGVDVALLVLYTAGLFLLLPLATMYNNYWDEIYRQTNTCQPWSVPRFINPYLQLALADLAVFLGIVSRFSCRVLSTDIHWSYYWTSCVGGALMVIAAVASISSMKRPDKTCRVYGAMLLQLLAGMAVAIAVVFCVNGVVDNVNLINNENVTLTDSDQKRFKASAGIYGTCAVLLLPSVMYCMAVLGSLNILGNKFRRDPYRDDASFESASTSPTIRARFRQHGHGGRGYPSPPLPRIVTGYPAVYPNYFGQMPVQKY